MEQLSAFAEFLRDYGPYAMASVFAFLYFLERRDRRATQANYEKYLVAVPKQMREFSDTHANAIDSLERAFLRSGINTE